MSEDLNRQPVHQSGHQGIRQDALEELVRHAMASGAMCFMEKVRDGQVDPAAPLMDAFDDFPAEFLRIRTDLVEALTEDIR